MHIPDGSVAYLAEEMLNSSASDEQTQNNEEVLAASNAVYGFVNISKMRPAQDLASLF